MGEVGLRHNDFFKCSSAYGNDKSEHAECEADAVVDWRLAAFRGFRTALKGRTLQRD
jgi:hypothetical protein